MSITPTTVSRRCALPLQRCSARRSGSGADLPGREPSATSASGPASTGSSNCSWGGSRWCSAGSIVGRPMPPALRSPKRSTSAARRLRRGSGAPRRRLEGTGGGAVLPGDGAHPMGLTRRRHFLTEGRRIIDLEDELFGDGVRGQAVPGSGWACRARRHCFAALERSRTGRMRDIVATSSGSRMRSSATRWRGSSSSRGVPARQGLRSPCTGRLPPVHPPLPARAPRRARGRAQPPVPALHRAGPAVVGRDRRRAVHVGGLSGIRPSGTEDRATTR